jgi:ketosteroid isomerase-like protein
MDEGFEAVFERGHVALAEFFHGNTEPFKELYSTSDDATLANPFGGVAHGWEEVSARLDRAATYFADAELVSIETISCDQSGDLGFACEIERARARVGGRATVDDWNLRTTTVYRREDTVWRLLHRHADPAVGVKPPASVVP